MGSSGPLLYRGTWKSLDAMKRADFIRRGTDKVFDPQLRDGVLEIIEDVRANGDAALIRALSKFDKIDIESSKIRVTEEEFRAARSKIAPDLIDAIRDLISHLKDFNNQLTRHGDWEFETEPGLRVGEKVTAIESVGLFVPSGKGSYPSVMAQLGTPAVIAGVREIAVIVPPIPGSDGEVDPAVLVVAEELGISNVFRANGPAGIAALAFGTETVPKVRKICGPGSFPVACAQVEVQRFGTSVVMLLGPSESLIIADESANPYFLAADLLNEAEHGPDSSSVLVTDSTRLLEEVQVELEKQLGELPEPRSSYARQALQNGGVVITDSVEESAEVSNAYAPEHMQIATANPRAVLEHIVDAGEVLLGQHTTVSMANFIIGCPASLPTSGFAKVSSGITADTFRKKTAVAEATKEALNRVAPTVVSFTQHEGFPAHELAVTRRINK